MALVLPQPHCQPTPVQAIEARAQQRRRCSPIRNVYHWRRPGGDDVSVAVTIRPASVDDADAIGKVHVRAWQSAYRGMMPDDYLDGLQAQDHAGRWREHLVAPLGDAQLLVVVEDDRVVGFASAGHAFDNDVPSDVGQLYAINLDPDVWGRGLGRALLSVATDRLRELGYVEAVLWVVPDNRRARRLYESEGWSDDDLRRDEEVFGVVVPEMRYRRRLVEPAGYGSVTPRMVVADPPAQVEFLRVVFGAVGEVHPDRPAEIRIGDSLVMVSSADAREPFPAFLYIYVDDVDSTYRRALDAGATSLEAPLMTPYGDRRAMVRDRFDNVYQIAERAKPTRERTRNRAGRTEIPAQDGSDAWRLR